MPVMCAEVTMEDAVIPAVEEELDVRYVASGVAATRLAIAEGGVFVGSGEVGNDGSIEVGSGEVGSDVGGDDVGSDVGSGDLGSGEVGSDVVDGDVGAGDVSDAVDDVVAAVVVIVGDDGDRGVALVVALGATGVSSAGNNVDKDGGTALKRAG
jgi:hypothetical protein